MHDLPWSAASETICFSVVPFSLVCNILTIDTELYQPAWEEVKLNSQIFFFCGEELCYTEGTLLLISVPTGASKTEFLVRIFSLMIIPKKDFLVKGLH